MIRNLAFTSIFTLMILASFAQKSVHKFGNIPMEEMEMTVYAPDSTAPAVVLLSTGHYKVKDYSFYVHKRIKILKQAGTEYGNFTLRVPSKGSIKASTFNLENGEIVETKLKQTEMIPEEITKDFFVYKLFLPNVKVGSVVEIEYSFGGLPFDWNFQEMIPVKYTELLIEKSQYFIFKLIHYGSERLTNLGGYHWVGQDMPAFKPEPRINSINNYMRRVEFEFERISIPGQTYREFATSWGKVGRSLMESSGFGGMLRSSAYLNEKAKEIEQMDAKPEAKIQAAFDYIQANIEWNGEMGVYATQNHRKNFVTNHSGNVAEINLCLVSLLQKAGMSAFPVALSTKANGYLRKYQPSINKLNYVVCMVMYDDKKVLLDATSKNVIPGVLPPRCLNGEGLVVGENESIDWVSLDPEATTFEKSFAQIEFDENLNCYARVLKKYNAYDYYFWKEYFDDLGSESTYLKSLEDLMDDMEIDDHSLTISKEKMEVSEKYKIDLSSRIDNLGNELILNPFVFSTTLENPFKSDTRISEVDLGYRHALDRTIMVKFPKNYTLSKFPEAIKVSTEDEKAHFIFTVVQSQESISLNYKLIITDPIISVENYPIFKTLYSLMIDKLNESLTLKKI